MGDNPVREKGYRFALRVIGAYRELIGTGEFLLSKQMVRAGTSIGANIEEALAGQSRRDFIAKMAIASKEARDCRYWLRLLLDSKLAPPERISALIDDCDELIRLRTSIVKTAQSRTGR
jgi:four helix bundle protein